MTFNVLLLIWGVFMAFLEIQTVAAQSRTVTTTAQYYDYYDANLKNETMTTEEEGQTTAAVIEAAPPKRPADKKEDSKALSDGGIAGIVIAGVVVLGVAIFLIVWYVHPGCERNRNETVEARHVRIKKEWEEYWASHACPTCAPVACLTCAPVACPACGTDCERYRNETVEERHARIKKEWEEYWASHACPTCAPVTCPTCAPVTCSTCAPVACPACGTVTCPRCDPVTCPPAICSGSDFDGFKHHWGDCDCDTNALGQCLFCACKCRPHDCGRCRWTPTTLQCESCDRCSVWHCQSCGNCKVGICTCPAHICPQCFPSSDLALGYVVETKIIASREVSAKSHSHVCDCKAVFPPCCPGRRRGLVCVCKDCKLVLNPVAPSAYSGGTLPANSSIAHTTRNADTILDPFPDVVVKEPKGTAFGHLPPLQQEPISPV